MATADRTNNTEQLQRFINNLCQHQQRNEFCDFTITTNNTSIKCHKLVLSSASSYFCQVLCDSGHNTNIIDVTPLPGHILRTVVAFMYNSDYVIDNKNVIELLKFSETWKLDILAKLCVTYINDNITMNNACKFYNFALDNVDQHKTQIASRFIREHFTSLHELGQLSKLSLKSLTTIIEHDEINVTNEDVIFSSAVQVTNQQTSVEDINRCLELIRFPHMSRDFLVNAILNHPLMKDPSRDGYVTDALLYHVNKTSTPEVKPPRYWDRGIYYIGCDGCLYQYVFKSGNNKCVRMMNFSGLVDKGSAVASYRERVVIVGGHNGGAGDTRALFLDMTDKAAVAQLPDLPEPLFETNVVLSDNDVYVVGGYNGNILRYVYYLPPGSNAWQIKTLMPCAVRRPLVIRHQQCIYVLGGYNDNGLLQYSVSQYNIEDDTWKRCSDMPVAWDNYDAGVVVHDGGIKVFTVDQCLIYADDTDTWTAKQYNTLGGDVKTFVRHGQIWAMVLNFDACINRMMSYDDVDNVWKTEHERIDNAWYTWLFC